MEDLRCIAGGAGRRIGGRRYGDGDGYRGGLEVDN